MAEPKSKQEEPSDRRCWKAADLDALLPKEVRPRRTRRKEAVEKSESARLAEQALAQTQPDRRRRRPVDHGDDREIEEAQREVNLI